MTHQILAPAKNAKKGNFLAHFSLAVSHSNVKRPFSVAHRLLKIR
jgi:hypothetical protein